MNKKIIVFVITFIIVFAFIFHVIQKNNNIDTVQFNGNTYVLLEYNMDIFTYNHNSNRYYEEDIIYPVAHNKWNVVYFNGDLFVLSNQVRKAINYYKDDKNYDWNIIFDKENSEVKKSIFISKDELSQLYNIEKKEERNTITFDDIDMFADILKVSKDGLVQAVVTLAMVDDYWYYKTEIMTDDDKEYVIKLSKSLNDKINNLID